MKSLEQAYEKGLVYSKSASLLPIRRNTDSAFNPYQSVVLRREWQRGCDDGFKGAEL